MDGSKRLWPIAAIMAANRRDLRVEIPKIQPDTEQALQRELAPELARLAELVGRYEWPWPTWRAAKAMAEERSDDGGQRAATAG
jgi:hypothetical protein